MKIPSQSYTIDARHSLFSLSRVIVISSVTNFYSCLLSGVVNFYSWYNMYTMLRSQYNLYTILCLLNKIQQLDIFFDLYEDYCSTFFYTRFYCLQILSTIINWFSIKLKHKITNQALLRCK